MTEFDRDAWEQRWRQKRGVAHPANPYLAEAADDLVPGTALDAGCGVGAEALRLASSGWQVTAVDLSAEALALAAENAAAHEAAERVRWIRADLTTWNPETRFDLVTTHYAHPAMPHPEFYDRIAAWVAPGGSLLIVGHREDPPGRDHHRHPATASTTVEAVTARLDETNSC
jgi:SAM-dependent methyltransferase